MQAHDSSLGLARARERFERVRAENERLRRVVEAADTLRQEAMWLTESGKLRDIVDTRTALIAYQEVRAALEDEAGDE